MVVLEAMDLTANEAVLWPALACVWFRGFFRFDPHHELHEDLGAEGYMPRWVSEVWSESAQVLTGESLEVSKSVELKDWVFLLAVGNASCCHAQAGER